MVNAVIAEDNKDLCIAIANELNVTKEVKVIAMIKEGTRVIPEIKRLHPDIVVLDMKMPGRNGLQIINDIENDASINTKVVIFSGEISYIAKVQNSKCVISYILKGTNFKEVGLKIQTMARQMGSKNLNQEILEYLLDLGFSTSNRGTSFLRECISIFLLQRTDECKVKELFKRIADSSGVNAYIVKNNIHTSTKIAWHLGNRRHIIDKLKLGETEEISPKKVITMAKYYIDID